FSGFDASSQILHVVNHYNNEFAGRYVFLGSSEKIVSYTTNRREFLGRNRHLSAPLHLENAVLGTLASLVPGRKDYAALSKETGAGFDSCGVLKISVSLQPGEERALQFFLGEAPSLDAARDLASRVRAVSARDREFREVKR